mgnify:CR=1 FL=1
MKPKKTSLAKKAGKTFLTAIVLVVLFFGWASINGFQKTPPPIEPENGCIDLTGIDLDKELITMGAHWDFYPNRLLYSDDFKSGAVTEDMKEAIRDDAPYVTYRVLLRGIPGSYYLTRALDQAFWNVTNGTSSSKDAVLEWSLVADNEIKRKINEYSVKED